MRLQRQAQHPALLTSSGGSGARAPRARRQCRPPSVYTADRAAAAALDDVVPPALAHAAAVVQVHGGWFAPQLVRQPDVSLLQRQVPFLTTDAGSLPEAPRNLNHALYMYGSYASKYVSVRVRNVHVKLSSWDHAVAALADAEDARAPYWCSLIERVAHPGWWPATGHVPTYDQVIFGRGNASIGLHFDKDNACAGGSRTPVSTYLAICSGAKLCLLLPPEQTLLPAGGDPDLLLRPTPQLLSDVKAAGGYFFLLQDVTQQQQQQLEQQQQQQTQRWGAAAAGSNGSSSSGDGSAAFSATALFMPRGWYHWLVGLTDWHVVYGGSFYPELQPWLRQQ